MPALSDSVSIWWEPVTIAQFGFFGLACKKTIVGDASADQKGRKLPLCWEIFQVYALSLGLIKSISFSHNHLFLVKHIFEYNVANLN